MKDCTLFYTETDSIDISKPLDPKYVGTEEVKLNYYIFFKPQQS